MHMICFIHEKSVMTFGPAIQKMVISMDMKEANTYTLKHLHNVYKKGSKLLAAFYTLLRGLCKYECKELHISSHICYDKWYTLL